MAVFGEEIPWFPGSRLIQMSPHLDERGSLTEIWKIEMMPRALAAQANLSLTKGGVLRGMHYHKKQTDFWYISGNAMFVALADIKTGKVWTAKFMPTEHVSIRIPPLVAHGFYAYATCQLIYITDRTYDGSDEFGVAWNDATLAIPWPDLDPMLSDRDRRNPSLAELDSQ